MTAILTNLIRAILPVLAALTFLAQENVSCAQNEPPTIPIGLDAYRMWEAWPYQRIGARAYMRGTYDRDGGNRGADASHFLYQESDDFNVTLDVEGPGVFYFARFNHWHGSPWHFEVNGVDHIVREQGTADPLVPSRHTNFIPERLFPWPLAVTWYETKGADLSWVPMPFTRSFRMAYSRTHYGTGVYTYHKYLDGIPLSRPITSWDENSEPDQHVLDLIASSGRDLAPRPGTPEGDRARVSALEGTLSLPPLETTSVTTLLDAPAMVRALEFSVPRSQALAFTRVRLKVHWDGAEHASIDVPIALFYGAGTLYNRDDREYLVKAFPMNIRFDSERVYLSCYFPMPFFRAARIELKNLERSEIPDVQWSIRSTPFEDPPAQVGYFHATYSDHPEPVLGEALLLLDTENVEGGGDWSGQIVGTSLIFTHDGDLLTLEGDPRFWFDDSGTPQVHGGGTEEWGGGGYYWRNGEIMTLPFVGHPVGAPDDEEPKNDEDKIHSMYRYLLGDLMPFGKRARIGLEHGNINDSEQHYEAVTYWYGVRAPWLILTDELDLGTTTSEREHGYNSPDASEPYKIQSRYEWGLHEIDGRDIYPAHTETGRLTSGTSEFTMRIDPENLGVMLRRKFDYAWPNQRAEVYIADGSTTPVGPLQWEYAGIWYTAGSTTYIYSNPKGELDPAEPVVLTSSRRFKDEEFLVPRRLTQGRSAIRIRVKFTPVERRLLEGYPLHETAWSEIRYSAYSVVMPSVPALRD